MVELPSGTVTLLFSDIEGSTALLARLGAAYADALDGQRRVLRTAWADHGGTELGTEGDSFFVAFPTALSAVVAAAQAQRDLAAYPWPEGEQVRVRMGIHTGSPVVHDGGYVGMDVHRAARIASSSHGGQVVVSEAAASLVRGDMPVGVTLRDLGSHRLKDIPRAEHLFQLVLDGLPGDFPRLKSLGASSTLPRPSMALVGRDGELAELVALLSSAGVRLVTLTGTGGSGKTRLAVGLAHALADRFADGVYFVDLSSVTSSLVMWSTIAEALDVPPEGRVPPGIFEHVAHRTALLVLDNLEQVREGNLVVAQLLQIAPQVVVVATSRRALGLSSEHVHPVPALTLPDNAGLAQAEASGAVSLFVLRAQKVKPTFVLTAENVADVAAVCRRLDGLPLAIELAAARTRLLSPKALLSRLDQLLDIEASSVDAPRRQHTLGETVAWSYGLLTAQEQAVFRRLGVFAGGADLEAVAAVCADVLEGGDPLDAVADVADASLIGITEDAAGEPRFTMLETIRAYAVRAMRIEGELDDTRRRHAEHYLTVVASLRAAGSGAERHVLAARRRFETELDNVRAALAFALEGDDPAAVRPREEDAAFGLLLCAELFDLWWQGGYVTEAKRWLDRAIAVAGEGDSEALGRCLSGASAVARILGDRAEARALAIRSVAMWRRMGDKAGLSQALERLAVSEQQLGEPEAARGAFEEAASVAEAAGDRARLAAVYGDLAWVEAEEQNFDRSHELLSAAADMYVELGRDFDLLVTSHNIACNLRMMGRLDDALEQMRARIPQMLRLGTPELLIVVAEDYGALLAEVGDSQSAARLIGAADAARERNRTPRTPSQASATDQSFAKARAALGAQRWEEEYREGFDVTVEKALQRAYESPGAGSGPTDGPKREDGWT